MEGALQTAEASLKDELVQNGDRLALQVGWGGHGSCCGGQDSSAEASLKDELVQNGDRLALQVGWGGHGSCCGGQDSSAEISLKDELVQNGGRLALQVGWGGQGSCCGGQDGAGSLEPWRMVSSGRMPLQPPMPQQLTHHTTQPSTDAPHSTPQHLTHQATHPRTAAPQPSTPQWRVLRLGNPPPRQKNAPTTHATAAHPSDSPPTHRCPLTPHPTAARAAPGEAPAALEEARLGGRGPG